MLPGPHSGRAAARQIWAGRAADVEPHAGASNRAGSVHALLLFRLQPFPSSSSAILPWPDPSDRSGFLFPPNPSSHTTPAEP